MKYEARVGLLFVVTVVMVAAFAFFLGVLNPFSNSNDIHLLYNFAGGIEVGSPIRVMGIKVGKVKSIRFSPNLKDKNGEEVKLDVTVSISKDAWQTVREDSRFYINLAGVIGEKYIEVSPGSSEQPELQVGGSYRGEDPPRIDQLISQSYNVAGKIVDFIDKNQGEMGNIIKNLDSLVKNVNQGLVILDKATSKEQFKELGPLVHNLNQISGDVSHVTGRLRTKDADETIALLHKLIWRLDELDKQAVKKFLQEEGIKARLF